MHSWSLMIRVVVMKVDLLSLNVPDSHPVIDTVVNKSAIACTRLTYLTWLLRGSSHRPLMAPSIGCDSVKSGGPISTSQHNP